MLTTHRHCCQNQNTPISCKLIHLYLLITSSRACFCGGRRTRTPTVGVTGVKTTCCSYPSTGDLSTVCYHYIIPPCVSLCRILESNQFPPVSLRAIYVSSPVVVRKPTIKRYYISPTILWRSVFSKRPIRLVTRVLHHCLVPKQAYMSGRARNFTCNSPEHAKLAITIA